MMITICARILLLLGLSVATPQPVQQSAPQHRSAPDTIPALLQDTNQRDLEITRNIEFPTFASADALADASDAIVFGRIVASRAFLCDSATFVCTQFRFKVRQTLAGIVPVDKRGKDQIPTTVDKNGRPANDNTPPADRVVLFNGPALDEIVVTVPGGTLEIDHRRVNAKVADEPLLQVGHDYVLFLKWSSNLRLGPNSEAYQPMAGSQAAIEVSDNKLVPLVPDRTHPLRNDIDESFHGSLSRLASHLAARSQAH